MHLIQSQFHIWICLKGKILNPGPVGWVQMSMVNLESMQNFVLSLFS